MAETGRTARILAVGVSPPVVSMLAERLAEPVHAAPGDLERALGVLAEGVWSLLVIDETDLGRPRCEALIEAWRAPGCQARPFVYFVSGSLSGLEIERIADTPRLTRFMFHPIDSEDLAIHAADALGILIDGATDQTAFSDTPDFLGPVWERFRPTILERVATLERAASELANGSLGAELKAAAMRQAHDLAGTVGSFGYAEGSRTAHEVEVMLRDPADPGPGSAKRLEQLVAALRRDVERPLRSITPGLASGGDRSRVLLIQDVEWHAGALAALAAAEGFEVEVASDLARGRVALDRSDPDLVVLDPFLRSGAGEGLAFLTALARRSPSAAAVVLTSQTTLFDRIRTVRLGGATFLTKPAPDEQILEELLRLRGKALPRGFRILAVDDDPVVLAQLRALLEPRGIAITILDNPLRFWEVLEVAAPDMLILDIDMPVVSGIELCRAVRQDGRWSPLPVVFLTALLSPESVSRVFSAGADDYVAKPLVGPELLARILNRLERTTLQRAFLESDPISGVANRARSLRVLGEALDRLEGEGGQFTVATVAIDGSSEIAARHGHEAADEVVRRLGDLLCRAFPGDGAVSRWGGDDFVVGIGNATRADVAELLSTLRDALGIRRFEGDTGDLFRVTFSAGIAQFPDDGTDLPTLVKAASQALRRVQAIGGSQIVSTKKSHGDPKPPRDTDVVLIEDDEALADLVLREMRAHGFSAVWLKDGYSAVSSLTGLAPRIRSRMVLLDLHLPGLDGLSVLERLANDGVLRRTKIIVLTSLTSVDSVMWAGKLGASEYLSKPFRVVALMERVRAALSPSILA